MLTMPGKRRQLIITADDFGYNAERDRGIVDCFLSGAITRTSLLVNGISSTEACAAALTHNIPLGLHLNLTEGKPISAPDSIRSLLSEETMALRGKLGLPDSVKRGIVRPDEISQEIYAQIELFKTMTGHYPQHVDGHQHIHIFPGIREPLADALIRFGIKETRLPLDLSIPECDWFNEVQNAFRTTVLDQSTEAHAYFTSRSIAMSDCFTGIVLMGKYMSVEKLQREISKAFTHVENLNPASNGGEFSDTLSVTCELMVHPGYPCPDHSLGGCGIGADDFSMSEDRIHELRILCSSDMRGFYETSNIVLTHHLF